METLFAAIAFVVLFASLGTLAALVEEWRAGRRAPLGRIGGAR